MGRSAVSEVLGTTPEQVQKKFAGVINAQFQYGATERLVAQLSDRELSDLAHFYQQSGGPIANSPLLKTFARRLSDKSLLRVASAFDRGAVEAAVMRYAKPSVQEAFLSKVSTIQPMLRAPVPGGGGGGSVPPPPLYPTPPSPNWNQTLKQIYLEFRTAPVGSMGVPESLAETALYAAARVSAAAAVGTVIGTAAKYVIQTYDPPLYDAIGGTVANMIAAFHSGLSEFKIGHYQSGLDQLFGYPVTNSGTPSGDWSIASPMTVYYSGGGACGW